MSQIAIPTSPALPGRRWFPWTMSAVGVGVLAFATYLTVAAVRSSGSGKAAAGQYFTVQPMDLEVKVVKDGELQAVNNIDIQSEVEGNNTIQTLVKEGSSVKQGDVLATLDSSGLKQRIEDTTIELQKAEADVTTSREMREIQDSQNAANLEAAQVALQLARLDLQDYVEAGYPQQLANAQTDLESAKITLKTKEEDLAQTRALFLKGFVTAADVKKGEVDLTNAKNAVDKADTALRRLEQYTHEMDLASKNNAVSQAEQKLVRVQKENASQLAQKSADVAAKEQNLSVIKRKMERLQHQLQACTITAPADGMVVYATSGDRNAQNPIQEGATVRESQTIMRLPDTRSMKVALRVQEAQIPRLHEGLRATCTIIGLPRPMGATVTKISVLADNSQRWWNPDLKEYPVDLTLDETPIGMKPGITAQAEILVSRATGVLAVPLTALYSAGSDVFVFVRDGSNLTPVKVKIGQRNETHAEVKEGLSRGQEVKVLQAGEGRELLEAAGIKVEAPRTRAGDEQPDPARRRDGQPRPDGPPTANQSGAEPQTGSGQNGAERPRRGNGGPRRGDGAGAPSTAPSESR